VAGPASDDARAAGERVEALLAELRSRAGPDAAGTAEELVTCLVRLYGAGLATIMRLVASSSASSSSASSSSAASSSDSSSSDSSSDDRLVAQLIADPLVESLLLIHDLHPLDTSARVKRALGRLGPGTEFLGVTDDGVVLVKLAGSCGHTAAAVEQAITDAAPEITGIDFAPRDLPLLQISRRRPAGLK
jgi:hypothetical protein